ncbi:MAG TPA: YciI family protein [Roseiarcus sp.]|nr:YciI family protein [Roseiarcus sp.]
MRVMVIVKATRDSEASKMPSAELIARMGAFNQSLIDAGLFVDAGGLKPSSRGARVAFSGEDRTVAKGPFPNVGQLASGYWIWKVKDLDEAIDWVKRCPNPMPGPSEIEIRELFEMEDFG